MKVLLLDGTSLNDPEAVELAGDTDAELRARGCRLEEYRMRDQEIGNCRGCFACWYRTPGECLQKDSAVDIARSLVRSDLMVMVTRTTFGGYSSLIKSALDRTISVISPFFVANDGVVRHERRYERYPAMVVIGLSGGPDPEAEEVFRELVKRNAFNFHSPAHAVGLVRVGTSPDDRRGIIAAALESVGTGFKS